MAWGWFTDPRSGLWRVPCNTNTGGVPTHQLPKWATTWRIPQFPAVAAGTVSSQPTTVGSWTPRCFRMTFVSPERETYARSHSLS